MGRYHHDAIVGTVLLCLFILAACSESDGPAAEAISLVDLGATSSTDLGNADAGSVDVDTDDQSLLSWGQPIDCNRRIIRP